MTLHISRHLFYKVWVILLITLAFANLSNSRAESQLSFDAQDFTLENGLRVIVVENPRVPAVAHMIWYGVGAIDDPLGASGLAHYLEHLMFKGTDQVPSGEFSKRIKSYGGSDNAFTSYDYTAYFQIVPKDKILDAVTMEADRMQNLKLIVEETLSENKVIQEERLQVVDNEPARRLTEQMRSALFGSDHVYHRPVIGWMDEIKSLTYDQAVAFYKSAYEPANATVVLAGDITVEEAQKLVSATYGMLENEKELSPRQHQVVLSDEPRDKVVMTDPSVRQPVFYRQIIAPSYKMDEKASLSLQVLSEWLGRVDGPLYQTLVSDKKLASGIGFSYDPNALYESLAFLSAWPQSGVAMEDLENAIDEFLNAPDLKIDEATLNRIKSRLKESVIFERDSLIGPAMIIGHAIMSGATLDDVENWASKIDTVTVDDVNDVLANYIVPATSNPQHRITGYLLPEVPEMPEMIEGEEEQE